MHQNQKPFGARAVRRAALATAAALAFAGPAGAATSAGFESTFGPALVGGDDVAAQVVLPFAVSLFGQSYSVMNVSSNGFATFGNVEGLAGLDLGADPWSASVTSFLAGPARITPEWFDWESSVFYAASSDRIMLTWEGNEYGRTDVYRAQAQIYADGRIVFAYDTPHAPAGAALAGITGGGGASDPGSTNYTGASLSVNGDKAIYMGGGAGQFANAISVSFTPDGDGGYRVEGDVPPLPGPVNGGDGGSPAPEPAAWALMIMGFGLAGAAIRRRRTAPIATR
ncbi:PEPxxWA-CTERM sorting domain-containing protein [Phenylobacterium sp.]|uniref:PEPxxWA-CTERM sorting domain-containing protein n=1 Tax=Phenylobacterium sp. TaxID=1871053 RepID=UPI0025D9C845|nr:PEPxxWA-CTERM sorting domain-containing protein [Phenylobacterium sp.]